MHVIHTHMNTHSSAGKSRFKLRSLERLCEQVKKQEMIFIYPRKEMTAFRKTVTVAGGEMTWQGLVDPWAENCGSRLPLQRPYVARRPTVRHSSAPVLLDTVIIPCLKAGKHYVQISPAVEQWIAVDQRLRYMPFFVRLLDELAETIKQLDIAFYMRPQ